MPKDDPSVFLMNPTERRLIEELSVGDEEEDYRYQLGEEQYSEGDKSEEDGDFGPEDDGV